MPRNIRADVWSVVDEADVRIWVEVHQRECEDFRRFLQERDPRTWREEFDRILAETVEVCDQN